MDVFSSTPPTRSLGQDRTASKEVIHNDVRYPVWVNPAGGPVLGPAAFGASSPSPLSRRRTAHQPRTDPFFAHREAQRAPPADLPAGLALIRILQRGRRRRGGRGAGEPAGLAAEEVQQ